MPVEHAPDAGVSEGDVLAGKFRIDKILGVGGMGVVVSAHHLHLDQRVAIKFMLPETLGNGEAIARFAREARAAVKIQSEHVARVSDVGVLENGAPYMVMEYLEGTDLAQRLQQNGALTIAEGVDFLLQACEAIAEAHSLGIIHRDLKPANLFVIRRPDGALSVKVLDFGISKLTQPGKSGADPSLTKTSALMGSPLYMSPEQMRSAKDVDARSDIWALGVILYQLLSGECPFLADTLPELVARVIGDPPPPLQAKRADISSALSAVVARCLEKDPARRYQTVAELAVALLPFAPPRSRLSVERISGIMKSPTTVPPEVAVPSEPAVAAGTGGAWGKTTSKPSSRGFAVGVFGLILIAGLGAVALFKRAVAGEAATVAPSALVAMTAAATPLANPASTPMAQAVANAPASASESPPAPAIAVASAGQTNVKVAPSKAAASSASARSGVVTVIRPKTGETAATPAAKVNCEPPWTIGSDGIRHWKEACLK